MGEQKSMSAIDDTANMSCLGGEENWLLVADSSESERLRLSRNPILDIQSEWEPGTLALVFCQSNDIAYECSAGKTGQRESGC